jgi:hypothetical protein
MATPLRSRRGESITGPEARTEENLLSKFPSRRNGDMSKKTVCLLMQFSTGSKPPVTADDDMEVIGWDLREQVRQPIDFRNDV